MFCFVWDFGCTLEVLPFLSNLSGDNNRFLCFGLPPSSDDDSEPLDSDDSEEPELESSLLDEEEEVRVVLGDFAPLVLFTANLGGIGICLALCEGGIIEGTVFVGETDHLFVGTGGFIARPNDFFSNASGEGFLSGFLFGLRPGEVLNDVGSNAFFLFFTMEIERPLDLLREL